MSVQVKGSGTIGGLDEGLVVSGIVTSSTQINVGSNIKIGNAGVVTATTFSGSGASLTNLPAANLTGTLPAISGANLTNLDASDLASGTIPTARLGSGTASSSTFLRGDSTFAAPPAAAISSIANDAVSRVLTTDGDGTATAHSEVKIETVAGNKRFSINRGTGSTEVPLLVRRTDASGIVAEFSNSGGYGVYIGQNGATGEGYIRTATGQPLVFTTNSGSGIANERLRITSAGRIGINETSPDGMLHIKSNVPAIFLEDTDGTHGQAIIEQNGDILKIRQDAGNASSGTGSVIQFEVDAQAYAKVDTAFGLKADNTCKAWLCYRSEAGNEGIIDDFNVATVNDETTGTFGVNLEVNVHRHGNGWSQSIVFGCYNDGSRQLIAGVGYAPSHGSNNPWWDVEDNFVRVQTQRSDNGTVLDAKVFNMAMFGDTGDLHPA